MLFLGVGGIMAACHREAPKVINKINSIFSHKGRISFTPVSLTSIHCCLQSRSSLTGQSVCVMMLFTTYILTNIPSGD